IIAVLPTIGKVTKYFSSYCQYSSRYDKYKAGIIENPFKPELSGGATTDIGVYTIYPMVVLFGKPSKVMAAGNLLSTGVDGSASVSFKFDDMDGAVVYSKISDASLPTQIIGEQGTITTDRINIISSLQLSYRDKQKPNEDITIANQKNEYFYEIEEFINIIESGKRESSVNSHAVSLAVVEVMDEIRKQLGVKLCQ
ncbi:MAG: oxidoreductase, partial [Rikenellaceae bacterium]